MYKLQIMDPDLSNSFIEKEFPFPSILIWVPQIMYPKNKLWFTSFLSTGISVTEFIVLPNCEWSHYWRLYVLVGDKKLKTIFKVFFSPNNFYWLILKKNMFQWENNIIPKL